MRKRVPILAFSLLILFALAAWQGLRPHEPVYRGKSLTSWLKGSSLKIPIGNAGYDAQPADEAVRNAGTNAIPVLLRFLRARDWAVMVKLLPLIQKLHIPYLPAVERNERGLRGFRILGPAAQSAVPALIAMCDPKQKQAYYAVRALGYIGPPAKEAIPLLWQMESSSPPSLTPMHRATVMALRKIWTAESAVPLLKQSLSDPEDNVRANAAECLSGFPVLFFEEAKEAVSLLVKVALQDTNPNVRVTAGKALKEMAPDAVVKQVVPAIVKSLSENPRGENRRADAQVLRALGWRAKPAVPVLLCLLTDEDFLTRSAATNALKEIDPAAAAKVGIEVPIIISHNDNPLSGPFTLTLPRGPSVKISGGED
jgi:HEAT repeat protein